jgi:hypothetical protein
MIFRRSLFKCGSFKLHSGQMSGWKIDCDALIKEDWETLAFIARELMLPFGSTYGIPKGGTLLANLMEPFCTKGPMLICDDVLTTGKSMEEARKNYPYANGLVVFARAAPPQWVTPIFQMRGIATVANC